MKLNTILAMGALALGFSSLAHAQVTNHIYITGSTAGRSAAHAALVNNTGSVFDAGTVGSVTFGGSSASGANFMQMWGKIGGVDYIVNCHWSGSEAGIADIAAPTSEDFLLDHGTSGVPNSGHTVASPSAGQLSSQTVDLAFADNDKAFSKNPGAAITGTKVGVITFQFVKEKGSAAGLTSVTPYQMRVALAGGTPLALMTGNAADTDWVYVTGRNDGSGTRVNTFGVTGFGIFSAPSQIQIDSGGNMIDQDTFGTYLGDYGYESGGNVAAQMGFDITGKTDLVQGAGGFSVIGYMSPADANTAVANGGATLSYDGIAFSPAAVKEGQYSFWGNYHVYRKNSASATATTVFNKLAASTGVPANANGTTLIKLTDMHAIRNGPTSDPVHF